MRRKRVLVSLLTADPADLNLARRMIAHDQLVLVTTPTERSLAEAVHAKETAAGAGDTLEILELAGHDARVHMDHLAGLLDRYKGTDLTLNAAGGNGALFAALLYTSFARGLETWFFQEGHAERLFILGGLELSDRVTPHERQALLALPDAGATSRHLAETLIVPRDHIEKAFRGLRSKGLVTLDAPEGITRAIPTESGHYVRDHLEPERRQTTGT